MPEYFTRDPLFEEPTTKTGGMASNMTLRDHFAAAVVPEVLRLLWEVGDLSYSKVAQEAYDLADALIAQSLK